MRQELGLPEKRQQRNHVLDRKQKRQETRKENKQRPNKRQKIVHNVEPENDVDAQFESGEDQIDLEEEDSESSDDVAPVKHKSDKSSKPTKKPRIDPLPSPSPSVSSDAFNDFDDDDEEEEDVLSRGSREYSPEVVLDENSKAFQTRQAEEDAEILALERKLGMKSKKGKKDPIFDDGFDDLLEDLEDAVDARKKSKREADEWLQSKRAKAAKNGIENVLPPSEGDSDDDNTGENANGDDFADFDDEDEDPDEASSGDSIEDDEEDIMDEYEDDEIPGPPKPSKPARENPYVAPITDSTTAKYVPPSRRKAPEGDTEVLQKLRKQAQGSLNKLSEANIISIVDEFSKFYQNYPRQDVTDITIDHILTAFAIPTTLTNTYIILHAAFISALYKIHGPDFGAEIVSKIVETFDKYQASSGKESLNLTSLLANLFTFNLTTSTLIFDHIRALLSSFGSSTSNSEDSAEHLLRIIRDCGPQLRSDDPTALKGIVAMMNETAAKLTADGSKINIRTRVMMDTITDLKNNKIRHNTNSAGVTGEHLTRMRKALGSISSRQLRGTEPLNLSRADILNSNKKGKWWLIGASWKGHTESHPQDLTNNQSTHQINTKITTSTDDNEVDPLDPTNIRSLAQSHNLTTPLRLSIFTALITAHSPPDALSRLTKLRLTRRQEPEIPRVLLTLCRAEPSFNPYYAALARQLLRERNHKMPFSIALWKFFGELGEQGDLDGSEDEESFGGSDGRGKEVAVSEIANVARLYARLVAKGCLKLDILKTLSIGVLGEKAGMWLEVFFIALLAQNKLDEEGIVRIFGTCEDRLRKGIAWFLRKDVRRSDLLDDKAEREKVKKGCKLVEAAFTAVEEEGED